MAYQLETTRLSLKVLNEDDLNDFYEVMKLDEVGKWLLTGRGKTRNETLNKIKTYKQSWLDYGYGTWGIYEKSTGCLIGQVGLEYLPKTNEIGLQYALMPSVWGKGYASEAAKATLDYGFNLNGVVEIMAFTRFDNQASRNVLTKLGFLLKGDMLLKDVIGCHYIISKEQWYKK